VKAAKALGMQAAHVRGDISESIAELDAILGGDWCPCSNSSDI
jgi:hypothetical protein